MTISWVSCDLKTGKRWGEVTVDALGSAGRTIGVPTSVTLNVRCWDAAEQAPVDGWDFMTEGGESVLVAVDENDNPLWAGMANRRAGSIAGDTVPVSLVTLEAWFNRRFVKDHTFTGVDQATIFSALAADAIDAGSPQFVVDAPATGVLRDRAYLDADDKTVLAAFTELMGVEDGLEFTVTPEWADAAHTLLRFRLTARTRIGVASARPAVTFLYGEGGNVIAGEYIEDYTEEHGANDVMAVSSGEGETRPQSAHHLAVLANRCRFERRITPSTSITETATLDSHAAAELAQTWDGLKQLTLQARLDDSTSLTIWNAGDDVSVAITSPRFPEKVQPDGTILPGYYAVVRTFGWVADFDNETVAPILVEQQDIP